MVLEKGKQTGKCSYSHNILTCLQLDLEKSGNVVLNNFLFCTKEIKLKVDNLFFREVLLSVLYRNENYWESHCQIADYLLEICK